jgi:hypothetical protein
MDKKHYIITLFCLTCFLFFACGDETDTPATQSSPRMVRKKISPPANDPLKPEPQTPDSQTELAKADTKTDGVIPPSEPAKPEKTSETPSNSELAKADIKTDSAKSSSSEGSQSSKTESKTEDRPDIKPDPGPSQSAAPSSKNGTIRKKIVYPSDRSEPPETESDSKPDESEIPDKQKSAQAESKPETSPNEKSAPPKEPEKKEGADTASPGPDDTSKPDNASI